MTVSSDTQAAGGRVGIAWAGSRRYARYGQKKNGKKRKKRGHELQAYFRIRLRRSQIDVDARTRNIATHETTGFSVNPELRDMNDNVGSWCDSREGRSERGANDPMTQVGK
jgi:hypothetical protein